MADSHCQKIEDKIWTQFEALLGTFDKETVARIRRVLLDKREEKTHVEEYIKLIKIHQKKNFHIPIEQIYSQTYCIEDKLRELFSRTFKQIDSILMDMQDEINEWTFLAPDIEEKAEQHKEDSRVISILSNHEKEIEDYLKERVKRTNVTEVTIMSDSKKNVLTPKIVSEICKLTSLEKLHFRWAENLE